MKTLEYPKPRQARVADVPTPKPGIGQVLGRSLFCNISAGTEMGFYRGTAPQLGEKQGDFGLFEKVSGPDAYPMRSSDPGVWWMGYANVSEVVEVGPGVTRLKVGDRVFAKSGHKDHQLLAEAQCLLLPPGMRLEHATLIALIEIAFNAVLDSRIKLLDTVAVFGMGTLGQLVLQMAKKSGANVIAIDALAGRLELAKKLGADECVNVSIQKDPGRVVQQLTRGRGADVVVEVSGNVGALSSAIRAAAFNGRVTVMSFYQGTAASLELGKEFHHKRIQLISSQIGGIDPVLGRSWTPERRMEAALELVSLLDLEPLISHRFAFADIAEALQVIDQHPGDVNAVLVKY
ncbi:MAG: zinc-binding alcohol dehydrogenase [Spirochaetia bacterium]|nr:zinc-binding alcohol dehydrogenase [Spirochaetia bacterium]